MEEEEEEEEWDEGDEFEPSAYFSFEDEWFWSSSP